MKQFRVTSPAGVQQIVEAENLHQVVANFPSTYDVQPVAVTLGEFITEIAEQAAQEEAVKPKAKKKRLKLNGSSN